MAKIVKEPFSSKRRSTYKSESLIGLIGWWRAFLGVVSLIFLKGQSQ
jgi:hypothetical protein